MRFLYESWYSSYLRTNIAALSYFKNQLSFLVYQLLLKTKTSSIMDDTTTYLQVSISCLNGVDWHLFTNRGVGNPHRWSSEPFYKSEL